MSENTKARWEELVKGLGEQFAEGEPLDLTGVLFLIGLQESGQGARKFKKDEKLDLMHIALCTVLEPFGYYEFEGFDPEGWPHYRLVEELPALKAGEQSYLVKQAVLNYFEKNGRLAPQQPPTEGS
jgi:hypothetical protein